MKSNLLTLLPETFSKEKENGDNGVYNPLNKLNNLTGKEWIKFTKSWFIHRPIARKENEILHPAKYPESLVKEFIEFFTKKGEWVLDPFLGTGSTLVAAKSCGRNGIGIELLEKYFRIAKKRAQYNEEELGFVNEVSEIVLKGNSLKLKELFKEHHLEKTKIKYCITSPPYWNQLKRNSIRQKNRKVQGLDTQYSEVSNKEDLGNIDEYDEFVKWQAKVFDAVYDVLENGGYLTVITNNVFADGRVYPLAYDTAISLTKRGKKSWIMKDEKIWCQDDKALLPLGVNSAWVGNRHINIV
ncbi:MAG: site-specific DNA-methyltransferase [Ignavibacteria bacterium]|nr:site-specific DNA-methyltransferase [Ignavibacteria bacterium]